jgi:hypothetical protein
MPEQVNLGGQGGVHVGTCGLPRGATFAGNGPLASQQLMSHSITASSCCPSFNRRLEDAHEFLSSGRKLCK